MVYPNPPTFRLATEAKLNNLPMVPWSVITPSSPTIPLFHITFRSPKKREISRESFGLRIPFHHSIPIPSMYGIFTYIWLIFMVNVGKYTIHGSYGICFPGSKNLPWTGESLQASQLVSLTTAISSDATIFLDTLRWAGQVEGGEGEGCKETTKCKD